MLCFFIQKLRPPETKFFAVEAEDVKNLGDYTISPNVCEMKHRLRAKAMIIVKVLTKSQLKKW
jgi:hypothetical protein